MARIPDQRTDVSIAAPAMGTCSPLKKGGSACGMGFRVSITSENTHPTNTQAIAVHMRTPGHWRFGLGRCRIGMALQIAAQGINRAVNAMERSSHALTLVW